MGQNPFFLGNERNVPAIANAPRAINQLHPPIPAIAASSAPVPLPRHRPPQLLPQPAEFADVIPPEDASSSLLPSSRPLLRRN